VIYRSILLFVAFIYLASCQEKKEEISFPKTDLAKAPLVPKPFKIISTGSAFGLDAGTAIFTSNSDAGFEKVGKFLSEQIKSKTGLQIGVNSATEGTLERLIYINQSDSVELKGPEAYQIYIKKDSILLNAKTAAGAFRGVQTLRQLIPEKSNDTLTDHPIWVIPSGKIIDAPRFEYRGSMLDVARHFFTVEEVKKYIDALAYYKFNTLHLHLTDDQGWRIEIKSWPKLTKIGGASEVGGGEGGFYTQEQFKDIVAYAAERHITIIPEIDMPGHTNAASLSYPFLHAPDAETPRVRTDMRVGYSSFDTKKDTVYSFLDDVIGEITAMTPGPYFHIGGDESHATKKSDYIRFVEKVQKIVRKHNKRMVGWNEIVQAELDSSSVIHFWNKPEYALKAIENGSKVIMSPAKKAYLDMKYDSISEYGLNWAGLIPVDIAYKWDPGTYVENLPEENILGIEAPLWSETISNSEELEYLAFPRLIGYAELGWSPSEHLDWDDYKERLAAQVPYLEAMQINYYPTKLVNWKKE